MTTTSKALSIAEKITKQYEKEIEELLKDMTEDEQRSFFYTLQGQISLMLFSYQLKQSFK